MAQNKHQKTVFTARAEKKITETHTSKISTSPLFFFFCSLKPSKCFPLKLCQDNKPGNFSNSNLAKPHGQHSNLFSVENIPIDPNLHRTRYARKAMQRAGGGVRAWQSKASVSRMGAKWQC
ncbi:hypothetical protein ElyMa_005911500 [Elysia marginata]|uniref:60S ribosomal protein L29 n=1 Tax=Elysia marginata TaxID=1093978 RepID=A0AAV4G7I1_9GAST|nr:hypothetical protein ElyMa_005911500 [Elysia marginata]